MSQHDYILDNQDGASFRADINSVLAAVASCNSGATAPATTYAYQVWHDTTTDIIKQRNAANTAWLNLADVLLAGKTINGLLTYTNQMTQAASQATTSGTFKDFTSIPSWVKRITLSFQGVSTNGSSSVLVQLGTGTPTTSGYLGSAIIIGTAGAAANFSSGFRLFFNTSDAATTVRHGSITITNVTGNVWAVSGVVGLSDSAWVTLMGGTISLAGVMNMLRVTTVNGTDTFDAGAVNILYE